MDAHTDLSEVWSSSFSLGDRGMTVALRHAKPYRHQGGPALLIVEEGALIMTQAERSLPAEGGQLALLDGSGPVTLTGQESARVRLFSFGAKKPIHMVGGTSVCNLAVMAKSARLLGEPVEIASFGGYSIGVCAEGMEAGPTWSVLQMLREPIGMDGKASCNVQILYRSEAPLAPNSASEVADLAIIGAGPAGLSLAAHALHHGLTVAVFGEPMSFWKRSIMPLTLRSLAATTNIDTPVPGFSYQEFARAKGLPDSSQIPFHAFLAYAQHFIQGHALEINRARVTGLSRVGHAWLLATPGGNRCARNVVVAVGLKGMERVPNAIRSSGIRYALASEIQSFRAYSGTRVAILGGAQSAAEIALTAASEGGEEVHLLVRSPRIKYRSLHAPGNPLFKLLFKRADRFFHRLPLPVQDRMLRFLLKGTVEPELRQQLDASDINIHTNVELGTLSELLGDGVRIELGGERLLAADHLIVATGYQYDVRRIPFLGEQTAKGALRHINGLPELNWYGESSLPGVFFAGMSALRMLGPQCQFVFGTRKVTPRIIERVLERQ